MTDTSPITGKLLTPSEREICLLIVSQEMATYSKRAQALLCLDEGITQKESCSITGLALGQLRYALSLYKKQGLDMFPQKVMLALDAQPVAEQEIEAELLVEEEEEVPAPTQEKKPAAPRQKSFEEMSASISELLEKVEAAPEEEVAPAKKEKKKKKAGKKNKDAKDKVEKKKKSKKEKPQEKAPKKKTKEKKTEVSLKDLITQEKAKKKAKKKAKQEKKGKKKKSKKDKK